MAHAPEDQGDDGLPEANYVVCIDEQTDWEINEGEGTDCIMDAGHATEARFISEEPLGFDNDADFYHHGNHRYEYPAKDNYLVG